MTPNQKIIEEFEKKFDEDVYGKKMFGAFEKMEEMKDFIFKALSLQKEEMRKKVEEHHCCIWGKDCPPETKNQIHGYCGYELDHGLSMEDILKAIDNL